MSTRLVMIKSEVLFYNTSKIAVQPKNSTITMSRVLLNCNQNIDIYIHLLQYHYIHFPKKKQFLILNKSWKLFTLDCEMNFHSSLKLSNLIQLKTV